MRIAFATTARFAPMKLQIASFGEARTALTAVLEKIQFGFEDRFNRRSHEGRVTYHNLSVLVTKKRRGIFSP